MEAWEADFLNDVYQIRQLKAEMTCALQQVSPNAEFWILNPEKLDLFQTCQLKAEMTLALQQVSPGPKSEFNTLKP